MIELYYWPTPNCHKITMFLEAAGLEYRIHPVDISAGDRFKPDFLAFSPDNRMPAMIDTAPADGGEPVTALESACWTGGSRGCGSLPVMITQSPTWRRIRGLCRGSNRRKVYPTSSTGIAGSKRSDSGQIRYVPTPRANRIPKDRR